MSVQLLGLETTGAKKNQQSRVGISWDASTGTDLSSKPVILPSTGISGAGSGSGLNADTLDSVESGSFLRSDQTDNVTSGTITFNSGTELDIAAGGTLDVNGTAALDGATSLSLPATGITGAGASSGLDADKVDGQEGSFYRNASNINAGTMGAAYLPATAMQEDVSNALTAAGKIDCSLADTLTGFILPKAATLSGTPTDAALAVETTGTGVYYGLGGSWNKLAHDADVLKKNGSVALTADWDAGGFEIRSLTFESDVATGTAPLTVASTTKVTNLNADRLDDQEGSYYLALGNATGTLAESKGGTGETTYAVGDLLVGDATGLLKLTIGAAGTILKSNGTTAGWAAEELLPTGTTVSSTLRWDGSNWIENTGLKSDASGNTTASGTLDVTGNADFSAGVDVDVDSQKVTVGASADGEWYHDGTDTRMNNKVGNMIFDNQASAKAIQMIFGGDGATDTFNIKNNSLTDLVEVTGEGDVDIMVGSLHVAGNLVVSGAKVITEMEQMLVGDNSINLNFGYEAVAAENGGVFANYLPTSTNDTANGAYVPPAAALEPITGTVSGASGQTQLTGVGTAFTTELKAGWTITIDPAGVAESKVIASITSNTVLNVVGNLANTHAAVAVNLPAQNSYVTTTGSATFSAGDVIQINGTANPGTFLVYAHAGTKLSIYSAGGANVPPANGKWADNSFEAAASDSATIRKINVTIFQNGLDGLWEYAKGANLADISFTDFGLGNPDLATAYSNGAPGSWQTITTNATNGGIDIAGDRSLRLSGTTAFSMTSNGTFNQSGNGQVTFTGNVDASNGLDIPDNKFLNIGTGNDLQMGHDATNTSITNITGHLKIKNSAVAGDLQLQVATGRTFDFMDSAGNVVGQLSDTGVLTLGDAGSGDDGAVVLGQDGERRLTLYGPQVLMTLSGTSANVVAGEVVTCVAGTDYTVTAYPGGTTVTSLCNYIAAEAITAGNAGWFWDAGAGWAEVMCTSVLAPSNGEILVPAWDLAGAVSMQPIDDFVLTGCFLQPCFTVIAVPTRGSWSNGDKVRGFFMPSNNPSWIPA
jgi:hypothetical protein